MAVYVWAPRLWAVGLIRSTRSCCRISSAENGEPIFTLLRREGWKDGKERVYPLYSLDGLGVRSKARKKRRAVASVVPVAATAPMQRWAIDFVHDTLADGGLFRVLSVVDVSSRSSEILEAGVGFTGARVAELLDRACRGRLPAVITADNGTGFARRPPGFPKDTGSARGCADILSHFVDGRPRGTRSTVRNSKSRPQRGRSRCQCFEIRSRPSDGRSHFSESVSRSTESVPRSGVGASVTLRGRSRSSRRRRPSAPNASVTSSRRPRRSRGRSESDWSIRPSSHRRRRCSARLARRSDGRSRQVSSASVSLGSRCRYSLGRSSSSARRRLRTRSVSRKSASVRRSSRGCSDRSSGCCRCGERGSRQTESLSHRTSGLSRRADRRSQYSQSLRRHSERSSARSESCCRQRARRRQRSCRFRLLHEERRHYPNPRRAFAWTPARRPAQHGPKGLCNLSKLDDCGSGLELQLVSSARPARPNSEIGAAIQQGTSFVHEHVV